MEEGTASHNFGLDELAPGKFCVLYSDVGGSGSCYSATEVVGVFEDARDFLAFVRHAELPRILDLTRTPSENPSQASLTAIYRYTKANKGNKLIT